MTEKKHVYESEVMGLPPLRMVLGEIPNPDPDRQHLNRQPQQTSDRNLEGTVKRLIAHLTENTK